VLVDGATDAAEAQRVLANLADAGRRYLSLALEPAGWVRADLHLARSQRLNVTVVDAFASSPAAMDYRQLANGLLHWPQVRTESQSGALRASAASVPQLACEPALH
jgi:flagellar biosynthesis protein FlhG